jgi:hypothetical protein
MFSVYRDHGTPVARATILSTDRKKIVGGHELGSECCEVAVNYIIKRDAILPRPIGNVTTMGQAQGRSIAWLYKHVGLFCFSLNTNNQCYFKFLTNLYFLCSWRWTSPRRSKPHCHKQNELPRGNKNNRMFPSILFQFQILCIQ